MKDRRFNRRAFIRSAVVNSASMPGLLLPTAQQSQTASPRSAADPAPAARQPLAQASPRQHS